MLVNLQSIVDCGVLRHMHKLLETGKESVKKEACWTLSNITAGTAEQIQAVIDEDLFPAIVQLLDKATFMTKKEAAWAVANVSSGKADYHVAE